MAALNAFFVLGFGLTLGALCALGVALVTLMTLYAFLRYALRRRG